MFYFTCCLLFCANIFSVLVKMAVHDILAPLSVNKSRKGNSELSCSFAGLSTHSESQTSRFTWGLYFNQLSLKFPQAPDGFGGWLTSQVDDCHTFLFFHAFYIASCLLSCASHWSVSVEMVKKTDWLDQKLWWTAASHIWCSPSKVPQLSVIWMLTMSPRSWRAS